MDKVRNQNIDDRIQSTDNRRTKKHKNIKTKQQSCSIFCNLNLSAFILLICVLSFLPTPLLAKEEKEGIELPEMVITGEDRSVLTREEKEEEILFPVPERERISLERELAKEVLPGHMAKRKKRFIEEKPFPSLLEVSLGSHNTLDYKLTHDQHVQWGNYLIKIEGGSSSGFDWKNLSGFGQISRHLLEGGVGLYREEWGIEGAVDYGAERVYLPHQERTRDNSVGGIRIGGMMVISPTTDLRAGIESGWGRIQGQQEDVTSTTLNVDIEFNTLAKDLPLGLGARMEHFLIDSQETDISRVFIQSKGISLDPFRLDLRVGIDNHHDHHQEVSMDLYLSWLWEKQYRLFLGYERGIENPSFKELYLENPYVTVNKDLLPIRMGEFRFGGNYQLSKGTFFNLTLFAKGLKDYVVLEDRDGDHLYQPTNIDASILGAQMMVESYLTPQLTQRSSLTYTAAKSRQEDGIVPFIPDLKASLLLKYLTEWGLEIGLNPEYIGLRKDGLTEETSKDLEGYFLLHLHLSQHLFNKALTLFLYGENLLDEEYMERSAYPGWPHSFGGGLTWRF